MDIVAGQADQVGEQDFTAGTGLKEEPITAVEVERDEDGVWVVECPSIPGCVSQGMIKEEALTNVKEAIALALEVRADKGMVI